MKKRYKILLVILLILAICLIIFCLFSPRNSLNYTDEDLSINPYLDSNVKNIALLGIDKKNLSTETEDQIDTMIILSINSNTNEIKMTSILRDTFVMVGFPDKEIREEKEYTEDYNDKLNYAKISSVYNLGGIPSVIKTLNLNLGLNIKDYALIDFNVLKELVDLCGGIEVDITDNDELNQINELIKAESGSDEDLIKAIGNQNLNGVQALAYIRNRSYSSDENRTAKQRELIEKLINKLKESSFLTKANIFLNTYPKIETSISIYNLLNLARNFQSFKSVKTNVIPSPEFRREGVIYLKTYLFPYTLKENVLLLENFIYGKEFEIPKSVDEISEALTQMYQEVRKF